MCVDLLTKDRFLVLSVNSPASYPPVNFDCRVNCRHISEHIRNGLLRDLRINAWLTRSTALIQHG